MSGCAMRAVELQSEQPCHHKSELGKARYCTLLSRLDETMTCMHVAHAIRLPSFWWDATCMCSAPRRGRDRHTCM